MADLTTLDFKVGALQQQLSDFKQTYESTLPRLQEQLALVRSSDGGNGIESNRSPPNVDRLVLGCVDFCDQILILQHVARSTRLAS